MTYIRDFIVSHVTTGIGATTDKYYLIDISAHNTIEHMDIEFLASVSPGCTYTLFENPTISANGTSLTIYNMIRSSTVTSITSIYRDPTVTSDGTPFYSKQIGSTTVGGDLSDSDILTFTLKTNTKYLVKFSTLSSGTSISFSIKWNENC